MATFSHIFEAACARKGGEAALLKLCSSPAPAQQLRDLPDDRYLAEMAKRIFCAGFVWRVVEAKWDGFEAAFDGFSPKKMAAWPEERLDKLAEDTRIIRNYQKICAVRENAWFVNEIAAEHGSFGAWVADWPGDDIIGLWLQLKKRGKRLGGMSGPMMLRFVGKDTFLLTGDVCTALQNHNITDKANPSSQKDLKHIQSVFNEWADQTGYSLNTLSKIVACSVG